MAGLRSAARVAALCALAGPALAIELPFAAQPPIAADSSAKRVEAADFDGDGDLDFIVGADSVLWLENDNGSGSSWSIHIIDGTVTGVADIAIADIDRDGDLDVAAALSSSPDPAFVWYENPGSPGPAWTRHNIVVGVSGGHSIELGDLDDDGDLDVVGGLTSGNVDWYTNQDGIGATWSTAQAIKSYAALPTMQVVDLDFDGDLDVLAVWTNVLGLGVAVGAWYANAGGGTGWAEQAIVNGGDDFVHPLAVDLDADGDPDVIAVNTTGFVGAVENLGGATSWGLGQVLTSSGPTWVDALDLDRDGDADLLSSDVDGVVRWNENDGTGFALAYTPHSVGPSIPGDVRSSILADVDGDGDADAVTTLEVAGDVLWFRNDWIHRSGHFPESAVVDSAAGGPVDALTADLDLDGDLDMVAARQDGDDLVWYENLGGGASWSAAQVIDASAPRTDDISEPIAIADMDGDGDPDVLAVTSDNRAEWHENRLRDPASWVTHTIDDGLVHQGPASITALDFDLDGDLDPVATYGTSNEVVLYENQTGVFIGSVLTSGGEPRGLAVGDIDRDGDPDLLFSAAGDDTVEWLRNDGGGTFVRNSIGSIDGPATVILVDMDGDGDLDGLTCALNDSLIEWYQNLTDGTSWSEHTVQNLPGCRGLAAADLDHDGDPDIAVAQSTSEPTLWLENADGVGGTWTAHPSTITDGSRGVALGDVDRDGEIDILIADRTPSELRWHRNRGGQFALTTSDVAPTAVIEGLKDSVLAIDISHRGRSGDTDVEFAQVEFRLEDEFGVPLTSLQIAAAVSEIEIFLDTGSGAFEEGSDTLIPLTGSSGSFVVDLQDGISDVQVTPGQTRRYFIVPTAALGGAGNRLRIVHITESSSTAEDTSNDEPLDLEFAPDTPSSVFEVVGLGADTDSDGLTNTDEINIYFTDPLDSDTDDDGLSDGDEVNMHGTDPTLADTDADGLSDGFEIAIGLNPLDDDHDDDTVLDGADNCPFRSNPSQTNSDSLAAGDLCQCGNVDSEGGITATDLQVAREYLAGAPLSVIFDVARCKLTPDTGDGPCDVDDLFAIARTVDSLSVSAVNTCADYFLP